MYSFQTRRNPRRHCRRKDYVVSSNTNRKDNDDAMDTAAVVARTPSTPKTPPPPPPPSSPPQLPLTTDESILKVVSEASFYTPRTSLPNPNIPNALFKTLTTTASTTTPPQVTTLVMDSQPKAVVASRNISSGNEIGARQDNIDEDDYNDDDDNDDDIAEPVTAMFYIHGKSSSATKSSVESVVSELSFDKSEMLRQKKKEQDDKDFWLDMRNMDDWEIARKYRCRCTMGVVKKFTRDNLFRKIKFIHPKEQITSLKSPRDVGNMVMRNMKITEEKEKWWRVYQNVVKDALHLKRAACNALVKSVVVNAMQKEEMPALEDILGGRQKAMQDENARPAYFFFCEHILECVAAGSLQWKKEKYHKLISSSCVTVSDEAFALLLLVNGWDRFQDYAKSANIEDDDEELLSSSSSPPPIKRRRLSVAPTKFSRGIGKKIDGWNIQGILKFNELFEFVANDRKSPDGKKFEKEFLEYMEGNVVRAHNDLWDDDDSVDKDVIGNLAE